MTPQTLGTRNMELYMGQNGPKWDKLGHRIFHNLFSYYDLQKAAVKYLLEPLKIYKIIISEWMT